MEKENQSKFQVTNNFNCQIGQYIANIEHQVVHFDKDMQPVFASEMQKPTKEFIAPAQAETKEDITETTGENLQDIFPYFTPNATLADLEILKKECQHRYAAAHVIDLLAEWEDSKTITKGYKIEDVYAKLVTFCNRYNICFVKQDSFETAYNKRYTDNRSKYCKIFK